MIEYMEERTKVVIYARVSTSTQDYTRQITELRNYAWKQNYKIVKEFSEKISGGKKIAQKALAKYSNVKASKVSSTFWKEMRNTPKNVDFSELLK